MDLETQHMDRIKSVEDGNNDYANILKARLANVRDRIDSAFNDGKWVYINTPARDKDSKGLFNMYTSRRLPVIETIFVLR